MYRLNSSSLPDGGSWGWPLSSPWGGQSLAWPALPLTGTWPRSSGSSAAPRWGWRPGLRSWRDTCYNCTGEKILFPQHFSRQNLRKQQTRRGQELPLQVDLCTGCPKFFARSHHISWNSCPGQDYGTPRTVANLLIELLISLVVATLTMFSWRLPMSLVLVLVSSSRSLWQHPFLFG